MLGRKECQKAGWRNDYGRSRTLTCLRISAVTCLWIREITPPHTSSNTTTPQLPFSSAMLSRRSTFKQVVCLSTDGLIESKDGRGAVSVLSGRARAILKLFAATRQSRIGRLQPPSHGTAATVTTIEYRANHEGCRCSLTQKKKNPTTVRGNARPSQSRPPPLTTRSPCISPNFDCRNEWAQSERRPRSVLHETKT
jgi:hypothetical protein